MNSCNRHNSAAPFPANGTAHASNAKVLLGRGRLTNEKSEAIFVFGRRVRQWERWGWGEVGEETFKTGELRNDKGKKILEKGNTFSSAVKKISLVKQLQFGKERAQCGLSDQTACPGD